MSDSCRGLASKRGCVQEECYNTQEADVVEELQGESLEQLPASCLSSKMETNTDRSLVINVTDEDGACLCHYGCAAGDHHPYRTLGKAGP